MDSALTTHRIVGEGAAADLVEGRVDDAGLGLVFPAGVGTGGRLTQGVALPIAVLAHVAGALLIVVVPLLRQEPLPDPADGVKAFFVAPVVAPPPPPPPPPAPSASRIAPKVIPQSASTFTAPVEIPHRIEPALADDLGLGVEGGVPGGVEGGVIGGVVGGVVGGLSETAPPRPPSLVRVGGSVKEPRKLKHVAPVYPDAARFARLEGTVVLEATINEKGKVQDVKVLHSIPLLSDAAVEAVKRWEYTPTLLGGVPVWAVLNVSLTFTLNAPRRGPNP